MGQKKIDVRAVFISDCHLLSRTSDPESLLRLLKSLKCDTLYLVGDVFDMIALKHYRYWPRTQTDIVRRILKMSKHCQVRYVVGNHDSIIGELAGHIFGVVSVDHETYHMTRDGRRLLVLHGDRYDTAVIASHWVQHAGAACFEAVALVGRVLNRILRLFGFRPRSLAASVRRKADAACQKPSDFRRISSDDARNRGYDGIVCGHVHEPCLEIDVDGFLYANCGDWVEHNSCIVEDREGRFRKVFTPQECPKY